MSDLYLLDANVFVQAKNLHYRFDFCGAFWDWLEAAHHAGLAYSVTKVRAELVAGNKGDPAREWAERQAKSFFLEDARDPEVMHFYGALMAWAASSQHYTPGAITEFAESKNADPFIVAAAKVKGAVVVTQERADPNAKRRIPLPSAANFLGIRTISIFDFLSRHAQSTFVFKP